MVALGLQVRPAVFTDQPLISNLIFFESHVHRHLDWRAPLDWLGAGHYWVLEDERRLLAVLACPQDPPGIAWLRLFAHTSHLTGPEAWAPLWAVARAEIESQPGTLMAVIALHGWLQTILRENNFQLRQHIIMLEWLEHPIQPAFIPLGVSIRKLLKEDLEQVVETDASAFTHLWHNSYQALEKALSQALFATVAEKEGRVIGYQISTSNPFGAHLARLAVRKEAQGQGVGKALMGDLFVQLRRRGLVRLSVNTQDDNAASLALYQKAGFKRTGEQYPVYVYP